MPLMWMGDIFVELDEFFTRLEGSTSMAGQPLHSMVDRSKFNVALLQTIDPILIADR
jgi:hypothetical protein